MGDRANIHVRRGNDDPGVYLYTHWRGSELPFILQDALSKRWRWDDGAYLARIIFDTMTEFSHGQESGFGISSTIEDGASRVLVVNTETKTVSFGNQVWTFDEYLALPYPDEYTWLSGE